MYHNEDTVLDARLNYLEKFVDNFVIVESTFNHRGQRKKLNFNIKNFSKFSKKINYLILDSQSKEIEEIKDNDTDSEIEATTGIDIKKFEKEIVMAQDYATKKMIGKCPKFAPKSSYLTKLGGEG